MPTRPSFTQMGIPRQYCTDTSRAVPVSQHVQYEGLVTELLQAVNQVWSQGMGASPASAGGKPVVCVRACASTYGSSMPQHWFLKYYRWGF